MQKDAMIERMGKAMAEADLWPGAWDGNMPHGYAMSDAEKNAWVARADAGFDTVAPLIAAAERERAAKMVEEYGCHNCEMDVELAAAIRARSDAP